MSARPRSCRRCRRMPICPLAAGIRGSTCPSAINQWAIGTGTTATRRRWVNRPAFGRRERDRIPIRLHGGSRVPQPRRLRRRKGLTQRQSEGQECRPLAMVTISVIIDMDIFGPIPKYSGISWGGRGEIACNPRGGCYFRICTVVIGLLASAGLQAIRN